jgi:CheY-like chemotaxis protein/nitrogen-specific signal transduction histidine kinase
LASVVFTNQIRDSNHRLRMAWEEMHEAKEEAERASRAKSAFVSRMSHELRTPMNAILGFSQLLEEEELKPEQKDFVLEINRAGVHLLELINQVLDLAKIEAGSMTLENIPFDPTQMVEQVATLIGEQARARELELRLEVSPDLPGQILGDPTRLRQVLINLAGNALKFTHQGGIDLRVALVEEGNRIEYSVRDSGIGMDAETLARLFRPFSQADESVTRKFGGTGLGLSIARDLVRAMGGEIHVESESGQGSRFWFSLPAVRAAEEFADNHSAGLASAPITEPVPLSENAGGTSEPSELAGHVLLVEDNNINQIIASRMLERLGLTHEIANNGREALEKIQAHTYDLILMDVQMPEMDGMDATRALRAWEIENARPRLPVIAMTANALSGDRSDCLASGMDDHLAKPVRVETLRALLAHWLPKQAGP